MGRFNDIQRVLNYVGSVQEFHSCAELTQLLPKNVCLVRVCT